MSLAAIPAYLLARRLGVGPGRASSPRRSPSPARTCSTRRSCSPSRSPTRSRSARLRSASARSTRPTRGRPARRSSPWRCSRPSPASSTSSCRSPSSARRSWSSAAAVRAAARSFRLTLVLLALPLAVAAVSGPARCSATTRASPTCTSAGRSSTGSARTRCCSPTRPGSILVPGALVGIWHSRSPARARAPRRLRRARRASRSCALCRGRRSTRRTAPTASRSATSSCCSRSPPPRSGSGSRGRARAGRRSCPHRVRPARALGARAALRLHGQRREAGLAVPASASSSSRRPSASATARWPWRSCAAVLAAARRRALAFRARLAATSRSAPRFAASCAVSIAAISFDHADTPARCARRSCRPMPRWVDHAGLGPTTSSRPRRRAHARAHEQLFWNTLAAPRAAPRRRLADRRVRLARGCESPRTAALVTATGTLRGPLASRLRRPGTLVAGVARVAARARSFDALPAAPARRGCRVLADRPLRRRLARRAPGRITRLAAGHRPDARHADAARSRSRPAPAR